MIRTETEYNFNFEILKPRENYTTTEYGHHIDLSAGSGIFLIEPDHFFSYFNSQITKLRLLTICITIMNGCISLRQRLRYLWFGVNNHYRIFVNDFSLNYSSLQNVANHFLSYYSSLQSVANHFLSYYSLLQSVANHFLSYYGLLQSVANHFLSYYGLLQSVAKDFLSYYGLLQSVAKDFLSYYGLLQSVAKDFINKFRKILTVLLAYKTLIYSMLNKFKVFYHIFNQFFIHIFISRINKKTISKLYHNFAKKYCNSILSPLLSMISKSYLNKEPGCMVLLQSSIHNINSLKNLFNYV